MNELVLQSADPVAPTSDELSQRAAAKTRAFIRWDKVYDKDNRTIWHWRFRHFYWKDYRRTRHVSVFDAPTSMAIETVSYGDNNKREASQRYIISFKGGKLGFFTPRGKGINRFSPLLRLYQTARPYDHPLKLSLCDLKDYPGIARNEKRLMRLFLSKCRANGIKVSPYARREAKTLGELVSYTYYPATLDLATLGHNTYPVDTGAVLRFLRRPFKPALKIISGHDSRKLTKLLLAHKGSNALIDRLITLRMLKGILPLDYLHQVMEAKQVYDFDLPRNGEERTAIWQNARSFLGLFKDRPALLTRWLTTQPSWVWTDTLRSYAQLRLQPGFVLPETNDLAEIHDLMTRAQRRIVRVDREIKHPETLIDSGVDGIKVGDYTLVLPKTTGELADWGEELNNCIGGYTNMIERGRSWILGLKEGPTIRYGIEMIPPDDQIDMFSEVRQFKGKHNVDAPVELVQQTRDAIDAHRLAMRLIKA